MKKLVAIPVTLAAGIALAADPSGVDLWKAADLKTAVKELAAKLSDKKAAGKSLAAYSNHAVLLTHREASGEAEIHDTKVDVFFVVAGTATLEVGGQVVNAKKKGPETLGSSIRGGVKKTLAPGDIVHIPAKTPHQLLIEPGATFTYVILKVDAKL
jgi:mannose-6-phosphate isomerase-like protein (cupin superfamily)